MTILFGIIGLVLLVVAGVAINKSFECTNKWLWLSSVLSLSVGFSIVLYVGSIYLV